MDTVTAVCAGRALLNRTLVFREERKQLEALTLSLCPAESLSHWQFYYSITRSVRWKSDWQKREFASTHPGETYELLSRPKTWGYLCTSRYVSCSQRTTRVLWWITLSPRDGDHGQDGDGGGDRAQREGGGPDLSSHLQERKNNTGKKRR